MAGKMKIATCNYCGTRAALVMDGGRHELVCSGCGAPLHDIKRVPKHRIDADAHRDRTPRRPKARKSEPDAVALIERLLDAGTRHSRRRKKPKRGRVLRKAFDLLDDIFD